MNNGLHNIEQYLFSQQDLKYRDFQSRLIPNIAYESIIGVRTPVLRAYAKQIFGTPQAAELLNTLPHRYYEENNLHAFIVERIPDFDETVAAVDRLLPYVDNWATCDLMLPRVFRRNPERLSPHIDRWLESKHTYTVRFGIRLLMSLFLDAGFSTEYPDRIAKIKSGEYYVQMMVAWYFATALAKQYDAVAPFIENRRLDTFTHNKAIQKAVESYRITDEQKTYLRTLRIKNKD